MRSHEHQDQADEPEGVDWVKVADALVWGSAALLLILFVEWVFGVVARKRISSMAERITRTAAEEPAGTDGQ